MRPIFKYRPAWALAIGDGGTEVITGDGGGGSVYPDGDSFDLPGGGNLHTEDFI